MSGRVNVYTPVMMILFERCLRIKKQAMQSAPAKKPSFKCPTFSVPAKKDGKESGQKNAENSEKKENKDPKKKQKLEVKNGGTDNNKALKNPKEKKEKKEPKEKKVKKNQGEKEPKEKKEEKDPKLKKEHQETTTNSEEKNELPKGEQDSFVSCKEIQQTNETLKEEKQSVETPKEEKEPIKTLKEEKVPVETAKEENQPIELQEEHKEPIDTPTVEKDPIEFSKDVQEAVKSPNHVRKTLNKDNNKKKNEYKKMPVRSLTEEEYDEIFDGAIDCAMKLDLETWEPKVSSPVKVREPKIKKYGKTVGKKSKLQEVKNKQPSEECHVPDKCIEDNDKKESVQEDDRSEGFDVTVEVCEGLDEEEALPAQGEQCNQEEEVDDDEEQENVQSDVQKENETTPIASEAGSVCVSPPPKKKKVILKKKETTEPKCLQFDKTKTTPMIDKIKKLKKMKKENQVIRKKRKTDLPPDHMSIKKKKSSNVSTDSIPKLKKKSKKKQMIDRDLESDGTWVQCCNATCMKWRHLPDICDPTQIPERWTCTMNTCEDYNSCDKSEQAYDESEHIYTKFTEGSVVWAKMAGYPWWPAMVEQDPDTLTFFSIDSDDSMIPTHFHVVFFDDKVSRIWVKSSNVKSYTGDDKVDDVKVIKMTKRRPHDYSKEVGIAKKNANRAIKCSLQTRIELFGFAARYKGTWGKIFETATPEIKDNEAEVKKHKKTSRKRTFTMSEIVTLDESTMDDVLDNTDAILDNVEELLDSLDSQLDNNSDIDSDFLVDELVVVEKKNMDKIRGTVAPRKNKQKNRIESSSDSEDQSDENEDSNKSCEEANQPKVETIEEAQKDTCAEKRCVKSEKEEEENAEKAICDSVTTKEGADKNTVKEFCDDNSKIMDINVSEKTQDKKKLIDKKQKSSDKTKKKVKSVSKHKNGDKDSTDNPASVNKCEVENSFENNGDQQDIDNAKAEGDTCTTKLSVEDKKEHKCDDELDDKVTGNSKELDKVEDQNVSHELEKDQNKPADEQESIKSDEELDLDEEKNVSHESDHMNAEDKDYSDIACSDKEGDDSDSEFDLGEDKETIVNAVVSHKLGNDSDSDFELEDRSMYDIVVDGAQKNRERASSPAQSLSQDSNPFDLMDEE